MWLISGQCPVEKLKSLIQELTMYFFSFFNFLSGFSFTTIHNFTGLQGKGEGISLTPLYHFHPLHGHLDVSRAITADSSPLPNFLVVTCKTNFQKYHLISHLEIIFSIRLLECFHLFSLCKYARIRVFSVSYIFLIRENKGQRKPVFWHIWCSILQTWLIIESW